MDDKSTVSKITDEKILEPITEDIEEISSSTDVGDTDQEVTSTEEKEEEPELLAKITIANIDTKADCTTSNVAGASSTTSTEESVKNFNSDSEDNLIEIEDPDDYLLYLETILKKIHQRFYTFYEENKTVSKIIFVVCMHYLFICVPF